MARHDPVNDGFNMMDVDGTLENSPAAIESPIQMIDNEISNDASLYSQNINDFPQNDLIIDPDDDGKLWVSDERVDWHTHNEIFRIVTPALEHMPTINNELEHKPPQRQYQLPVVNEGYHYAANNQAVVHQQNEVQMNAEAQHPPENIHRNPVIRRGPGRPRDGNQTKTAKRAEKSRNKYKKLDAAALNHGSPPIQHALQLGFEPPRDFEKAVEQFKVWTTWNRDININFGDYLPITGQDNRRGPKPKQQLTTDEEHKKAQNKSGVKFYLLLYSLKHLERHADDAEYCTKFCDTIPNTEKELRDELKISFGETNETTKTTS
uniref:Reverse transcriptase domain-containing protein n=1 Tax=Panagrellus redivivus TaxID=6233 RepID=A0A7E4ZSK0_PANRE